MGTRSLTRVMEDSKELLCIYRQMDGYPTGMGEDLKDALKDMTIVNGYGLDMKAGTYANGMGCLAAQLVAKLKDGIGSIYIFPVGSKDVGEEYEYVISDSKGKVHLKVSTCYGDKKVLYEGLISKFDPEKAEKEGG